MTNEPYVPIDCEQHSRLEVLAMRRALVSVVARDEAGAEIGFSGRVRDLLTRGGAEYLVVDEPCCEHAIRLDQLRALYDPTGGLLWHQDTGDTGGGGPSG